ncbi:hypothetical protein I5907_02530 [Panacibacter sp. DH6]|uniref:Uncharacterized protein n=1 Tax=Panacibacter microcysteis TaxID=2793269 RepID=A0A931GVH8_9BACT|nr:hypothetical protein [Panacibacter microcysteis]MBG9375088.1 hypothetical protein [Panacibacter microcysteis]
MDNKNLWPDFENIPKITSPRSILIEQASFLAEKTKNLLSAEVGGGNTKEGRIYYRFIIIAPLLKNYTYRLFTLSHDIFYYPCEISFQSQIMQIGSEDQLIERLKLIFNNENTQRIIASLIGQSKDIATEGSEY